MKYLQLSVQLRDDLRTVNVCTGLSVCNTTAATTMTKSFDTDDDRMVNHFIPSFILNSPESTFSRIQMRFMTDGLLMEEVEEILRCIALEHQAHVRRVGKSHFSC